MAVYKKLFGELFKKFRLKSGFETLSSFGDLLAQEGFVYENSIFSRWQKGNRFPKDRKIIIRLLKIFIKNGAIISLKEANLFMDSVGLGYLNEEEKQIFFQQINGNGEETTLNNSFLNSIKNSYNPLLFIEEQIHLCNQSIYLGYPDASYKILGKLAKLLKDLKLDRKKGGLDLLNRIMWMRLRCLSDITKPNVYKKLLSLTDKSLTFAKEFSTSELGPSYWIKSVLNRIELLSRSKLALAKSKFLDCISLSELALTHTPKKFIFERIRIYLELAKLALVLKDKIFFERQMYNALNLIDSLSLASQFFAAVVWQIKARGDLRLYKNVSNALDNIQIARNYVSPQHQVINVYLQKTEIRALRMSKDLTLIKRANKIQTSFNLELSLLGNSYPDLRMKKRSYIGL